MPSKALSLRELRSLSDDEIVKRYDEQAKTTAVGTGYFEDELNRRFQERQTNAMLRLTKWIGCMTFVVTVATLVNVILAAIS